MKCETLTLPDGVRAIVCRSGMPRCRMCSNYSKYQCDYPIGLYKSGKKKDTTRTCDAHLCETHAKHGVTPGVDFCPAHYVKAKAAYEKRNAKTTLE